MSLQRTSLTTQQECQALASSLPDNPETVIAMHCLQRGIARAWVRGRSEEDRAVVIQDEHDPAELTGFGSDPGALADLLRQVSGWQCIVVDSRVARPLGELLAKQESAQVHYLDDLYHLLHSPPPALQTARVRLLGGDDLSTFEAASEEFRFAFWESSQALFSAGVVAGAVISQHLAAIALTSALSERYADMSVFTAPEYRGRGLSTAAASLVISRTLATGRVPVWSCGAKNKASLRVAEKLGFRQVAKRTYVILEREEAG